MSCGDGNVPTRIVTGVISDTDGQPIAGAFVSVGHSYATTEEDGSYTLAGLDAEASGPITASAAGYSAWSLDTDLLTGFSTQLRSRSQSDVGVELVTIALGLDSATTVGRTIYVVVDNGLCFPVYFDPGTLSVRLELGLVGSRRQIAAIGPPLPGDDTGIFAQPRWIQLDDPSASREIGLDLERVEVSSIPVTFADPMAGRASLVVDCNLNGVPMVVAKQDVEPGTTQTSVAAFGYEVGLCKVVVSYGVDVGWGPVTHVGLVTDRTWQELLNGVEIRMPLEALLGPEAEDRIVWNPLEGATVYEVFVAPYTSSGVGTPIWSVTTQRNQVAIPSLPDPALAAIDIPADLLSVRVVARHVPDFDIE